MPSPHLLAVAGVGLTPGQATALRSPPSAKPAEVEAPELPEPADPDGATMLQWARHHVALTMLPEFNGWTNLTNDQRLALAGVAGLYLVHHTMERLATAMELQAPSQWGDDVVNALEVVGEHIDTLRKEMKIPVDITEELDKPRAPDGGLHWSDDDKGNWSKDDEGEPADNKPDDTKTE